jgi:HD-like signal output (HDOD) protein
MIVSEHPNTAPAIALSVPIPPRPALFMAIQHEMRKEDCNTKKIAQLVKRDAAMAGTLLKSVNSAFYGLRREISTIEEVIAVLGMNQCSAIICGLVTKKTLGVGAMMMARFWDVSEKRARGMSFLAGETRAVAPDAAYNFGLFCDIGIPLLKASCPSYLETLSIANRAASDRFLEVEDHQHGVNHAQIGAQLAEHWSISSEVVSAIGTHHNHGVLYDESVDGATRALVALNHVVEKAIEEFRGEANSLEWLEGGTAAREALDLSSEDVDEVCSVLKMRFRSGAA